MNHTIHDICTFHKTIEKDSFVGLKIQEGKPIIYLPLGYLNTEEITGKDIDNLLTAIKRFASLMDEKEVINDDFEMIDYFPYFSYKWIFENYRNYGYFKDTEYTTKWDYTGKINWKQTIYQNKPMMTSYGPIYKDWMVRKCSENEDNMITNIHKFCVYESHMKIGWLFSSKLKLEKPMIRITTDNKEKYLKILRQELNQTFKDSKKELLKHMIKIIMGIDTCKNNKKEMECGTTKFYMVWEKMIDKAFGNVKNKEMYYPRGVWYLPNRKAFSTPLKPDTIKIEKETAYIYDAKYYSYCNDVGNLTRLPSTDSIQKQITYAEYIDKNPRFQTIKTIYNAFLLPGSVVEIIKPIGFALSEWKDGSKEYHSIYTFLLDTKYLINHYLLMKEDLVKDYLDSSNIR